MVVVDLKNSLILALHFSSLLKIISFGFIAITDDMLLLRGERCLKNVGLVDCAMPACRNGDVDGRRDFNEEPSESDEIQDIAGEDSDDEL